MTGTVTPVSDLYEVSSELRGFISCWVQDRRCPLPLVDWLLERDLPVPAEAARWAADENRLRWEGRYVNCGPYPIQDYYQGWYWYIYDFRGLGKNRLSAHYEVRHNRAHDIDSSLVRRKMGFHEHTDEPGRAMIWLLDHWILEGQKKS